MPPSLSLPDTSGPDPDWRAFEAERAEVMGAIGVALATVVLALVAVLGAIALT